jgi:hypothetical protein
MRTFLTLLCLLVPALCAGCATPRTLVVAAPGQPASPPPPKCIFEFLCVLVGDTVTPPYPGGDN